jgi:hypothetical protein
MHRAAFALALLMMAAAPALAQTAPPACESAASFMNPGDSRACSCSSSATRARGVVFGTDRYTIDSHICTAAVHAGQIGREGGTVTVYRAEQCFSFKGSTRNGITTTTYDRPYESYAFVMPLPLCGDEVESQKSDEETARQTERFAADCAAAGHGEAYCGCAKGLLQDTAQRDVILTLYAVEDALVSGKKPSDTAEDLVERLKESPLGVLFASDKTKLDLDKTLAALKDAASDFNAKLAEACHE